MSTAAAVTGIYWCASTIFSSRHDPDARCSQPDELVGPCSPVPFFECSPLLSFRSTAGGKIASLALAIPWIASHPNALHRVGSSKPHSMEDLR